MTAPGNFGRQVGGAAGRGAALVGAAVLLGLLLLWFAYDGDSNADGSKDGETVTQPEDSSATDPTSSDTGAPTDSTATSDVSGATGPTTSTIAPAAPSGEDVLHDNNTVTVMTANGSGTSGEAGRLASTLSAVNYITDPANADPTSTSKIYFRPGFVADARNVATELGAPADLIQLMPEAPGVSSDTDTPARAAAAQIIVIVGSDGLIP